MDKSCCQTPEPDGNAHNNPRWRLILWIALIANAAMFVVEIVAGVAADSRALQADALDFFGDAANYAISLGVAGLALSWRAKAALVKAATMLVFGLWVIGYAVYGLVVGSNPAPQTMGVIGTLALVVNVFVALMLSCRSRIPARPGSSGDVIDTPMSPISTVSLRRSSRKGSLVRNRIVPSGSRMKARRP